jgi:hypothetical protein
LTAAITGTGRASSASSAPPIKSIIARASSSVGRSRSSARSPPLQKAAVPAPVRINTRREAVCLKLAHARCELLHSRMAERVHGLWAVKRQRADAVCFHLQQDRIVHDESSTILSQQSQQARKFCYNAYQHKQFEEVLQDET